MSLLSLQEIQNNILSGEYTCKELVLKYLAKIKATKHLNIYIEVWDDDALDKAEKLDKKISNKSSLGSLFGAVVSIKDVLLLEGKEITAGSAMLQGHLSSYTSTVVQSLLDEDAIIIGRTNCDEFAMGSANENPHYGAVKNPHNENNIAGGSSGGSSAAVAAETCLVSIGSDTGGSIRQPASHCNVIGFKPTYGTFSRYGLIAYASSFDQVGVISKNMEDIELFLEVLARKEKQDFSQMPNVHLSTEHQSKETYKVAVFKEFLELSKLNQAIKEQFEQKIECLQETGKVSVEFIHFSLYKYLVPTYYILASAEASSNLSRFDGIRYGYQSSQEESKDWMDWVISNRTKGFGREVKRRIMMGNYVLSSGYYDAFYKKALETKAIMSKEMESVFADFDFVLSPTSPIPPRAIDTFANPVEEYQSDIYTVLANLIGIPAISIPSITLKKNCFCGLQILASWKNDKELIYFTKFANRHVNNSY